MKQKYSAALSLMASPLVEPALVGAGQTIDSSTACHSYPGPLVESIGVHGETRARERGMDAFAGGSARGGGHEQWQEVLFTGMRSHRLGRAVAILREGVQVAPGEGVGQPAGELRYVGGVQARR